MLKGAIIGFGGQGKQLALAMKQAGIEIVAVCDSNPKIFGNGGPTTKDSWAASFPDLRDVEPLPKIYQGSAELFLDHTGLDVVCVATWTGSHAPECIAAAESGAKAILCEEPMALSLAEARGIIDVCKSNGTLLTVNHTRRWWPAHQEIKKLISTGAIGNLSSIYISCGGARLGMLGTHWIDFARWITGARVCSVTGWLGEISEDEPRGPLFRDPPGQILIEFDNKTKAFIDQGSGIALRPRYTITGTTGFILNEQFGAPTPRENWQIWRLEKPDVSPVRSYLGEMIEEAFPAVQEIEWKEQGVEALKELLSGETSCPGEDGYNTLEVLIAAHLSHDAGNIPILLPFTDNRIASYRLQHA